MLKLPESLKKRAGLGFLVYASVWLVTIWNIVTDSHLFAFAIGAAIFAFGMQLLLGGPEMCRFLEGHKYNALIRFKAKLLSTAIV